MRSRPVRAGATSASACATRTAAIARWSPTQPRPSTRTFDLTIAKEAASRARSALLENISHELRAPLNAIMGFTDLALESATDPPQREQLRIINQLLDVSDIEAKRFHLDVGVFSQADASMTRSRGGAGLGLSICMRLAQMMRGTMGVDSTPGIGSRFWFTARLTRTPAGAD